MAVTDVNQDGKDDFVITGNGAPNRVYSYDKKTDSYLNIIDGVVNMEVRLKVLTFVIRHKCVLVQVVSPLLLFSRD